MLKNNPGYFFYWAIFMQIELSNCEWPFLRLLCSAQLPTITVIVRYTIFELVDVGCIALDVFYDYFHKLNKDYLYSQLTIIDA